MANLITVNEASKLLGISPTSVYKRLKKLKKKSKIVHSQVVKSVQGVMYVDMDYLQKGTQDSQSEEGNESIKEPLKEEQKQSEVEWLRGQVEELRKDFKDLQDKNKESQDKLLNAVGSLTNTVAMLKAPENKSPEDTVEKESKEIKTSSVPLKLSDNTKWLLFIALVVMVVLLFMIYWRFFR